MSSTKPSFLEKVSRTIGLFRGLFLPFGLFAVVAVGIHAGSDRVDDHAFVLYNFLDATLDDVLGWLITQVYGLLGVGSTTIAAHTFHVVDFIDLDVKDAAARWTALFVELSADLILAIPIFRSHPDHVRFREMYSKTIADFTVLRVAGPLAAVLASISGVLVIAREIQVATHGALADVGPLSGYAGQAAAIAGMVALVLVTWRLGANVTAAAVHWADRRAALDRDRSMAPRRRRLRGWATSLIILPITLLAVFQATPVVATLRALWPA